MARTYLLFWCLPRLSAAETPSSYSTSLCSTPPLAPKQEKLTHLHFYFHDILTGAKPTAVVEAKAQTSDASPTEFGTVVTMDDPLEGPELSSELVGRAQGMYASTSQSEFGFLMVITFMFTHGEYEGSTFSVLGREPLQATVRETPIVGGTGVFQFARGYALTKTHALSFETKNAVVEYDVYVFHY